jgi:hypothetical protein
MRHSGGKISAFVAGATVGLIAAEAIMYATCPPYKRMLNKKGVRAMRVARNLGDRLF